MTLLNADWLATTQEAALEPELPICDPHHHLWVHRDAQVAARYVLDDFVADLGGGHNIVSTVFIECGAMYRASGPQAMRAVGETEFVNGIAAMSASGQYGPCRVAAGIVGNADLKVGTAIGEVLDAHIAAGGGRFRGVRDQANWDASDAIGNGRHDPGPHDYLDAGFRQGFAELAPRGLTFEAWCFHPQIVDLLDLAQAFPDTTIILNHFGGPLGIGPYAGRRDEIYAQWQRDITALSKCANVVAKLGGINMEINGFNWHLQPAAPTSEALMEATRPWYEYTLNLFGPERCMFESNFPVDKISCSYNVVWNSFKRLTATYSADERRQLFHDTAMRVYRLG